MKKREEKGNESGSKNQMNKILEISVCNHMVTSEIREQFHACFVQILIISRAFFPNHLISY